VTCTTRLIGMFQKINGMDVLALVFYAHEFPEMPSIPAVSRQTFLSCIDGMQHTDSSPFLTGACNEVLASYLDWARLNGCVSLNMRLCPLQNSNRFFEGSPRLKLLESSDGLLKWMTSALVSSHANGTPAYTVTNIFDDVLQGPNVNPHQAFARILPHFRTVDDLFHFFEEEEYDKEGSASISANEEVSVTVPIIFETSETTTTKTADSCHAIVSAAV